MLTDLLKIDDALSRRSERLPIPNLPLKLPCGKIGGRRSDRNRIQLLLLGGTRYFEVQYCMHVCAVSFDALSRRLDMIFTGGQSGMSGGIILQLRYVYSKKRWETKERQTNSARELNLDGIQLVS